MSNNIYSSCFATSSVTEGIKYKVNDGVQSNAFKIRDNKNYKIFNP